MKALVFTRYGKSNNIKFAEIPRPVPKPDEILVQVHAAAEMLNEEQREAASVRDAPSAIGETVAINCDEARRRGQVVFRHASGLMVG